jgi:hypothetical protein
MYRAKNKQKTITTMEASTVLSSRALGSIQYMLKTLNKVARQERDFKRKQTPESQGADYSSDSQHQIVACVLAKAKFFCIVLACLTLQQLCKEQTKINKVKQTPVKAIEFHDGKHHEEQRDGSSVRSQVMDSVRQRLVQRQVALLFLMQLALLISSSTGASSHCLANHGA